MKQATQKKRLIQLYFVLTGTLLTAPAYAYLEPGTGSMLLQLVLGGFGSLAVIIKLYWNSVVGMFCRFKKD